MSIGYQRVQQIPGDSGKILDGTIERLFVRLGRRVEARQLSGKLERGGPNLIVSGRRIEIILFGEITEGKMRVNDRGK